MATGSFLKKKNVRVRSRGEAWAYLDKRGADIIVAMEKGEAGRVILRLTRGQMKRWIELMERPRR